MLRDTVLDMVVDTCVDSVVDTHVDSVDTCGNSPVHYRFRRYGYTPWIHGHTCDWTAFLRGFAGMFPGGVVEVWGSAGIGSGQGAHVGTYTVAYDGSPTTHVTVPSVSHAA